MKKFWLHHSIIFSCPIPHLHQVNTKITTNHHLTWYSLEQKIFKNPGSSQNSSMYLSFILSLSLEKHNSTFVTEGIPAPNTTSVTQGNQASNTTTVHLLHKAFWPLTQKKQSCSFISLCSQLLVAGRDTMAAVLGLWLCVLWILALVHRAAFLSFYSPWSPQGQYAWVQGRRATSKVTATSGGRLTNRYAWVPGRPTRRACLGVNLLLRVPPCKHYPEEVMELKMATLILLCYRQRLLWRNRIFRDRTNPLHKFNDLELFWQFRFRRVDILQMTNELKEELEHLNRKGALPPVFSGRRTALNPCQQWTSIAPQFPFLFLFLFFVFCSCCVFVDFVVCFVVVVFSFFLSLSLWRSLSLSITGFPGLFCLPICIQRVHFFSSSFFFFFFFGRAGRKDWIIWRACVEALITGKPQKEFHHLKITDS